MYIKSIKLSGFKSFVERTTVSLERGITAIVGPNGCGKSNICDSLRWVFGEQSTKLLRGGKMEELIFNGSESRKAVGMAEVAVTLSGLNGAIKKPELSSFDEITVTRRLFRSGESAYLINKTNCRLKDIVEIFLDTGISTRSFSIMEQAQVNRLIVSRPFERRYIIEEAAGVIKYKHRRHEALNKIEASRQNLLRIQDITKELGTQMNSLKRQAGKAKRYKDYKDELNELGVSLLSFENELLKSLYLNFDSEYQELKKKGEETEASVLEKQGVVQGLRTEIGESNKKREEKRRLEFEARTGMEQAGGRMKLMAEQKSSLVVEISRKREDVDSLKRDIVSLSEKFDSCGSESLQINEELSDKDLGFIREKKNLGALTQGMTELEKEVEESERKILDTIEKISNKRNRLTEVETLLGGIAGRVGRLDREMCETRLNSDELTRRFEAESSAVSVLNETLRVKEEEGRLAELTLKETLEKIKELDSFHASLRETYSKKKGLLESRQELKKNFEGFGGGVKAVMAHRKAGRLTGIRKLLVDIFQTSPDYETALEATLGEKLSAVIVDDVVSGTLAVEILRENREGNGAFIPIEGTNSPACTSKYVDAEGLIGRAFDLLEHIDPEYRSVAENVFGNVLIFNTRENALNFYQNQKKEGWMVVTLDGTAVNREGVVTGGMEGEKTSNLLSKNREILELQNEVKKIGLEVETLESRRNALALTGKECEESQKRVAFEIHELKVKARNSERDKERLSSEAARLKRKQETLTLEIEQVAEERAELEKDSTAARTFLKTSGSELERIESDLFKKKEATAKRRGELDILKEKMTASKFEVASLRAKLEFLSSEKSRISKDKESTGKRVSRLQCEIKESEDKVEQVGKSATKGAEEVSSLSSVAEVLHREISSISSEIAQKASVLKNREQEFKSIEKKLSEVRDAHGKISLKRSEARMRIEHLQKRGVEEFSVETGDLSPVPGAFDEPAARDRLLFLRKELERYGDVNLTAISECEKVEERYTFLKKQEDDLVQSVRSLDETIKKIDQTTGKLFSETFENINENFKKMFRRLFGGGKAELVLVESEEGKDPGIDILVQPPGKKLRNIQLMSAGEKAMTAISILFSVFMVRPSPFCLLDEIDAPLDDSNIGRFREMVKELVSETQFVIITHNQKTMTFADRLYGVTMEEHGVSKVLSVDVKEDNKEIDNGGVNTDAGAARLMEDAVPV